METTLAQRLRVARLNANLSQSEVAQAAGISGAALSMLESGKSKKMMAEALLKTASRCGVEPYWLGLGEGPMATKTSRARALRAADVVIAKLAGASVKHQGSMYDAVKRNPRYQKLERSLDAIAASRVHDEPRRSGRARRSKAKS